MMRQREPSDISVTANGNRVFDSTVTPSSLLRIFLGRELRVMNDKIGTVEKFAVAKIPAEYGGLPARQFARVRLVIRGVNERRAVRLNAKAEGQGRVVHEARADAHTVD